MIVVADVQDIQYGLLESADLEELIELLADVFSRFDPPAAAAGLSFDDARALVRLFAQRAPYDALTIVAREQSSGKLIGAMLTDDFATPPPGGVDNLSEHFHPIAALLDGLDEQYRKTRRVVPGEILHLFMLGVSPEFGGKGIAHTLVQLTLDNGKRNSYKTAITEATGNVSQHIFRKLGFIEQFCTAYKEFHYHGKQIFETIVEHDAVILMERKLDA